MNLFKFLTRRSFCTSHLWLGFIAIFTLASIPIHAAPQKLQSGRGQEVAARMTPIERLPATQRLKLAVSLPLRNQAALDQFIRDVSDPTNPGFRQYLTPEQFAENFGPTREDYQGLLDFAKANGLEVKTLHPNRLVLDMEGPADAIERAFHVNLKVYNHPNESRKFFAPDTAPVVDLPFSVLAVEGLDNFSIPKPHSHVQPLDGSAIAPRGGSGPGGSYRGSDFRAAYVPGTSLTGAGQSVGLLQFDGYYPKDITNYVVQAGLPSAQVIKVPIDGGVTTPGSGNGEVCLDIEMVLAMAPGISNIYVYEAPNPSPWVDLLSRMANDNLCKQLSCSWGGGSPVSAAEQIFKQMAAQGQSFFNASGDTDAFNTAIDFPSESTNITQVGGTTLSTTGPGGAFVSETVWNSGGGTGSSGGIGTFDRIPAYQTGMDMSQNGGSTTMRNVPDVALTGDNVYVTYNNGSSGAFDGTSCAAPLWAGFTALMNQQATAAGQPSVGFLNPAIYAIGKGPNYATAFHDTTTGNNTWSGSPTKFYATSGYDLCTGWGTPAGANLINLLAGAALSAPVIVSNSLSLAMESCSNGVVDSGETVTMNFGLKNTGTTNTTSLTATLLNSGGILPMSGPQVYGSLLPNGTGIALPFTFVATGSCGATNTASLHLQDGTNNLGIISFSFPLGQIVSNTIYAQNFDADSAPALPAGWTTSNTGGQSAWVTSTTFRDTSPNAAFSPDATATGVNELDSPVIALPASPALLSFRHRYGLENGFDGGVLEIKIGGGAWTDIIAAGGSFQSGGYVTTLSSSYGNPLAGRLAWTGTIASFVTTVVKLPASASGQNIQLRWRCGSDASVGGTGWYVDSVTISGTTYACCANANAPVINSSRTSGAFNLQWNALVGRAYQVQFNSALTPNTWSNLGGPMTASTSTMSVADPETNAPHRFYRVILLP